MHERFASAEGASFSADFLMRQDNPRSKGVGITASRKAVENEEVEMQIINWVSRTVAVPTGGGD